MITKHFIITKKGRDNGLSEDEIYRCVDHVGCQTYGHSSLDANYYFKGHRMVGVDLCANKEEEIDEYVKVWVDNEYLKED